MMSSTPHVAFSYIFSMGMSTNSEELKTIYTPYVECGMWGVDHNQTIQLVDTQLISLLHCFDLKHSICLHLAL